MSLWGGSGPRRARWPVLVAVTLGALAAGTVLLGGTGARAGAVSPPPTTCTASGGQGTCTLLFTSSGTWQVPAGVTTATVTVDGGAGGTGWASAAQGGAGSSLTASLGTIPAGTGISVMVGRAGADGGTPGAGGGGGGASEVAVEGTALVVAGGGGGSGAGSTVDNAGGAGGPGSSANGSPGAAISGETGQGGASGATGGTGGRGDPSCTSAAGEPASAGGVGGAGGDPVSCGAHLPLDGGGGGEGAIGGGGGGGGTLAGGGGGGGADFVARTAVDGIEASEEAQTAHPGTGSVTITYSVTAPAFTTPATATFTVGQEGSFMVAASGVSAPGISLVGTLPEGLTFTAPAGGVARLFGTPAPGSAGTYPLTLAASNGVIPEATQPFLLTVRPAPAPATTGTSDGGAGPSAIAPVPLAAQPASPAGMTQALPAAATRRVVPPGAPGPAGVEMTGTQTLPAALAVTGIDLRLCALVATALLSAGGTLWALAVASRRGMRTRAAEPR